MMKDLEIRPVKDNLETGHSELIKRQPKPRVKPAGRAPVRFTFSRLSIKMRLPLLIGTLLLGVIIATTWAAYREVKESALEAGAERLRHVTQQLTTLLQQTAGNQTSRTFAVANNSLIRTHLRSPEAGSRSEVAAALRQFLPPADQISLRVELWDKSHSLALALPEASAKMPADLEAEFTQSDSSPSFSTVGAIRVVEGNVVYPIVASVKDDLGQPIGHLVRWRKLIITPEAQQRFMNLIGGQAKLYLGNNQGELWTDLVNIAPNPPVDMRLARDVTSYIRDGNSPVTALGHPINGTSWFVLVEFSDRETLAQANRFLRRMMMIGFILLAVGLAVALVLSRSITQPLRSLTETASAIAGGDYSRFVPLRRHDELGALANAFNLMVIRMRESQRDLEQKVWQRTGQLEAANKELESFSFSVSHDLRAPLRAVAGFSRILREDYEPHLPPEAQQYLQRVQENAQQMGRLIDDLLAFSRLGRQGLGKQPVSPAELARAALEELFDEQEGRWVKITVGDLPVCQADPALLKQVFINLLANALKFTREQEIAEIEIGCRDGDDGEGPVYFVKDNGVGFDMHYAHKLFAVFQRLHRADEYEGTGVGLAIVQRIINRHAGRIWAESELGRGATFYFTLGRETNE